MSYLKIDRKFQTVNPTFCNIVSKLFPALYELDNIDDTKHRAASLRQQSYLSSSTYKNKLFQKRANFSIASCSFDKPGLI